mmetsp:Transcript_4980/g.21345  ORF Transcript_4980/g.21345 Transcript_4980/m.21345 type:complete len:208 (-) Transcript_4980:904-1527(-)
MVDQYAPSKRVRNGVLAARGRSSSYTADPTMMDTMSAIIRALESSLALLVTTLKSSRTPANMRRSTTTRSRRRKRSPCAHCDRPNTGKLPADTTQMSTGTKVLSSKMFHGRTVYCKRPMHLTPQRRGLSSWCGSSGFTTCPSESTSSAPGGGPHDTEHPGLSLDFQTPGTKVRCFDSLESTVQAQVRITRSTSIMAAASISEVNPSM